MNAALTARINSVYALTSRPDKVAETLLAVKAATLKMHQSDYYLKDLYETGIQFSSSDYYQQLDYRALIPLYRALKYLRKYDPTLTTQPDVSSTELEVIDVDQVFDDYKIMKTDTVYLAGQYLNIRTCQPFQYFILGCYLNPNISDDGYASWIAQDHPYAIDFEAARVVFKTMAYDEQAAAYEKLVAEQVGELKAMNILARGY
jgi:hypothetical protein